MDKLKLYHGSSEIIEKPLYGLGKARNDYGRGFYCTEESELANEWACGEGKDGFVNCYEIETDGLNILNLSAEEYSILHWLTLLMENREVRLTTPIMKTGTEWLKKNYMIDIGDYDIVIGYRADDSYFSFARAFVNNEISLEQLSYAMRLGNLGEQVVLKSEKAFQSLKFISYKTADSTIYYTRRKARDDEARSLYNKEIEKEALNGVYIRDLIREGGDY